MPLYDYECLGCGNVFDAVNTVEDCDKAHDCPASGIPEQPLSRLHQMLDRVLTTVPLLDNEVSGEAGSGVHRDIDESLVTRIFAKDVDIVSPQSILNERGQLAYVCKVISVFGENPA